jgi:hypothetical protein
VIVETFMGLLTGVIGGAFGLIPPDPMASVAFSMDDLITPLSTGLASLGAWVPWQPLVICSPLVFGVYSASMLVRAARAVIGHLPFIGGNG